MHHQIIDEKDYDVVPNDGWSDQLSDIASSMDESSGSMWRSNDRECQTPDLWLAAKSDVTTQTIAAMEDFVNDADIESESLVPIIRFQPCRYARNGCRLRLLPFKSEVHRSSKTIIVFQ